MESEVNLANEFIGRILDLSADAHVRRRLAVQDSPEFYNLTGMIKACGTLLALFTALQRLRGLYVPTNADDAAQQCHDKLWV